MMLVMLLTLSSGASIHILLPTKGPCGYCPSSMAPRYSMQTQCPNSSSSRSSQLFKSQYKRYTPLSSTLVSNMRNARSLLKQTQCLNWNQLQDTDNEFEKEMNHSKKKGKQLVEENNNNAKESRAKFQMILDKA